MMSNLIFNQQLLMQTKNSISSIGNTFGPFKTIELSNNILITCFFSSSSMEQLDCFSGSYTQSTGYSLQVSRKAIITNCPANDLSSFSFYKLSDTVGIIGCGGVIFKMRKIDGKLNLLDSEVTFTSSDAVFVDFLPLSSSHLFFGIVKQGEASYSYYKAEYYFPVCQSFTISATEGDTININEQFSSLEGIKYIMVTELPLNGKLSYGSSKITANVPYPNKNLKYSSETSVSESFKYKSVDYGTFFGAIFYSEECTFKILLCDSDCATCSAPGSEDNPNCDSCDNSKYLYNKEDDEGNCASFPADEDGEEGYYLDTAEEPNIAKKCFSSCKHCSESGSEDEHHCTECIDNFYILIDHKTNCYDKAPEGYIFSSEEEAYVSCGTDNCKACKKEEDSLICTECKTSFEFFVDNPGQCVSNITIPGNTYKDDNKVYQHCYTSCKTCSKGGNDDSHNCDSCDDNLYFKSTTIKNCVKESEKATNEYINSTDNTFYPCYTGCATCSTGGTEKDNKCDECDKDKGYSFIESTPPTSNCVTSADDNYYLDEADNTYKKCHSNCATCKGPGDDTNNNCETCAEGLSFSGTQCVNTQPSHSYLDSATNTYLPCFSRCDTCSEGGDDNNNNCDSCLTDYYFEDGTSNCYTKEEKAKGYYFISDEGKFYKCYESCDTCSTEGSDTKHNCLTCIADYYFIVDNPTNCISLDEKQENYYLDESDSTIKPCTTTCKTCSAGYDASTGEYNCKTCIDGYKLSQYNPTNCVEINKEDNNCFPSCQDCDEKGDAASNKCKSCKTGFHWKDNKVLMNCLSESQVPSNYYLDSSDDTYKQCYSTCKTCEKGGNDNEHNCLKCLDNLYFDNIDSTSCVNLDSKLDNFYIDGDRFKPCYESCATCSNGYVESTNQHNCITCVEHFYIVSSNCYDQVKEGQYYDAEKKQILNCYSTCKTCSTGGNGDRNNCDSCKDDTYPIETIEGNCLSKSPVPYHFYFDEDTKMFRECHKNCYSCSKGYDDNNQKLR